MKINKRNKLDPAVVAIIILILFFINPAIAVIFLIKAFPSIPKDTSKSPQTDYVSEYLKKIIGYPDRPKQNNSLPQNIIATETWPIMDSSAIGAGAKQTKLDRKKKYLHIALNSTLEEAEEIISQLPASERILIEVGTPLIKIYGTEAISKIKMAVSPGAYIVADNKCADLAGREVEMMANAGANAATCLGVAPIETIDGFVEECEKFGIDSILDMMNVTDALSVLRKLKKLPDIVMLHRGVDESELAREKQIPYYQIKQIKGNYNLLVAVAGGDTINEVQSAIFNGADIVVVWKNFYTPSAETAKLAKSFLSEVK